MQRVGKQLQHYLRPLSPDDNEAIRALIQRVMPEFGAVGPGFSIMDAELQDMAQAYEAEDSAYFVISDSEGRIVAGSGVGPLVGGTPGLAELKKMYAERSVRGLGLGRALMDACLNFAIGAGYRQIYLESMSVMAEARTLYQAYGFKTLQQPIGNTGHHGCDIYMLRDLATGA